MTEQDIQAWVVAFEKGTIDVAKAHALLGPARGQPKGGRVPLSPTDPSVESAQLEIAPDGQLEGMSVNFAKAIDLPARPLIARFGPPKLLPRLKPAGPTLKSFPFKGPGYDAQLLLAVDTGGTPDVWPVRSVTLRRFFPD